MDDPSSSDRLAWQREAEDALMRLPNVLLLVDQKLEEDALAPADRLPGEIANTPTDVVGIGRPVAGGGSVPPATVQALPSDRARPGVGPA
jgi:hypothetical protein